MGFAAMERIGEVRSGAERKGWHWAGGESRVARWNRLAGRGYDWFGQDWSGLARSGGNGNDRKGLVRDGRDRLHWEGWVRSGLEFEGLAAEEWRTVAAQEGLRRVGAGPDRSGWHR